VGGRESIPRETALSHRDDEYGERLRRGAIARPDSRPPGVVAPAGRWGLDAIPSVREARETQRGPKADARR
jgi:hypothetical protein